MERKKLIDLGFNIVAQTVMAGASYQEGQALFFTLAELMKQIDLTPNADDDALSEFALNIFDSELEKLKAAK